MEAQRHGEARCWCGNEALFAFSADYLVCRQCESLVLRRPAPGDPARAADEQADFYGLAYFTEGARARGHPGLHERTRSDLSERCVTWLRTLLKYREPPARILEVGCASGAFVGLLAAAGFDATGLDLSPAVTSHVQACFDVPVLTGPLEAQRIAAGSLDAIAMMDVVEHLPDPVATLAAAATLLGDDGLLLIQTPQFDPRLSFAELEHARSPFLDQLRPEQHLFLFSRQSISALLDRAGLGSVGFQPAHFPEHDMFVIASRHALREIGEAQGREALRRTRGGRIVDALIDLSEARDDLSRSLSAAKADQKDKERVIVDLTSMLQSIRGDQQAKETLIRQMAGDLAAIRADQRAKEKTILFLTSEVRALRGDQHDKEALIRRTADQLEAARADQRAKEQGIARLTSELQAVRGDQQAKEVLIRRMADELAAVHADQLAKQESISILTADLQAVRGDQQAKEELIRRMADERGAFRADQLAKQESISLLTSELQAVRGDQQAKEALIRRMADELEAFRADQKLKEEVVLRVSAELEEVRADQRAKEALIQRMALELGSAPNAKGH